MLYAPVTALHGVQLYQSGLQILFRLIVLSLSFSSREDWAYSHPHFDESYLGSNEKFGTTTWFFELCKIAVTEKQTF